MLVVDPENKMLSKWKTRPILRSSLASYIAERERGSNSYGAADVSRATATANKRPAADDTPSSFSRSIHGRRRYGLDYQFFDYDRNQMNVLEVNKTDYETCNSDHPLVNWSRGSGRDLIPLNVTKHYYIISGKGFCYAGMKLAINVENPPPSPSPSPLQSRSSRIPFRAQIAMPIALAVAALWDFLLRSL
ncbi:hypothetical protein Nepgr_017530 [Nepenthes gracilis]|uniref:Phytocyanin domain-containing protein n=1 Tax=Nepenthes gracilis TaxID=150966 RepID=A0AAD3XT67_NEPGR|nr:hypothetical protein Nepgr_017530 [Nepenthes gracilis]